MNEQKRIKIFTKQKFCYRGLLLDMSGEFVVILDEARGKFMIPKSEITLIEELGSDAR